MSQQGGAYLEQGTGKLVVPAGKAEFKAAPEFQADLASGANGAAIAAAVNGLRDALVAIGAMQPDD